MTRFLTRAAAPTAVVLVAALCAGGLLMTRTSTPAKVAEEQPLKAVTVVGVERGPVPLSLTAVGEVAAARDVTIQTEASGTISWVLDDLHAGLHVSEGEVVARIDPTSYDADLAAAEATLAEAREALALEKGSGSVAALEAQLVGPIAGSDPALLRREPQLATATANVASAEAAVAQARRQRRQTSIRAPFDAILAEESLDVGRLVASSTELGRWVGTSRAEVTVAVPSSALPWFRDGTVSASVRPQGARGERQALSVAPTGVVDTTTRTARVLVQIDAPYDTDAGPVLLPGSFAEVTLSGGSLPDASRLPAEALVDGSAVWSVGSEGTLRKVPVEVLWRSGDEVVIAGVDGLSAVIARPSGTLLDGQVVAVRGRGEG